MRKEFFFLAVSSIALFYTCKNKVQNNAIDHTKQTIPEITEIKEGYVTANENGNFMKATINGKEWNASVMSSYSITIYINRVIGEKGADYISFPFNPTWDKVDTPRKLTVDGDVADLSYNLYGNGLWAGIDGEIVIVSETENAIEGIFYFTAVSSNSHKSFKITDGKFRLLRIKN